LEEEEEPTDQPSTFPYIGFTGVTSQSSLECQALLQNHLGSASFLADGYRPAQDMSLSVWLAPLPFFPQRSEADCRPPEKDR